MNKIKIINTLLLSLIFLTSCKSKNIPIEELKNIEWESGGSDVKKLINEKPESERVGNSKNVEALFYEKISTIKFGTITPQSMVLRFGEEGYQEINSLYLIGIRLSNELQESEVFPFFLTKFGEPDIHYRTFSLSQESKIASQKIANMILRESGQASVYNETSPKIKEARRAIWRKSGTLIELSFEPRENGEKNSHLSITKDYNGSHFKSIQEKFDELKKENKIELLK